MLVLLPSCSFLSKPGPFVPLCYFLSYVFLISSFLLSFFSSSSLFFLFSFSSNIAKLSSLVSNLAQGNDLPGVDDGSRDTKNSDMLEFEDLGTLLGVSADALVKDLCTVCSGVIPDCNTGALATLIGPSADAKFIPPSGVLQASGTLGFPRMLHERLDPGTIATLAGVSAGMITSSGVVGTGCSGVMHDNLDARIVSLVGVSAGMEIVLSIILAWSKLLQVLRERYLKIRQQLIQILNSYLDMIQDGTFYAIIRNLGQYTNYILHQISSCTIAVAQH